MISLEGALDQHGIGILTPEATPKAILRDLERHPALQRHAFAVVRRAQINAVLAASEQLAIARESAQVTRTHVEGLGQLRAVIEPRMMNFLCWKYGPSWFRDKDALRDTLKRHPEMKATSVSRTTTVRVNGLREK